MKLDIAVNEVVLSNVGTTGEFKIRNSAKAFSILSSGLYSNKIKAVIRELSCNALDSHVGAGKATVPFEVHLPTMLEPWFAVRDFGMGLDGDQVVNIYTTYFESTKTNSNDFIGALGLGSKSPFSYTENFTVTAIKNGYKRIYSAFINEAGVPSIAEMSEELTDEGNGVEVKFSVTDRYDYNSFFNEAQNVFMWFEQKPTITGMGTEFQHRIVNYIEQNIVPGIHTRSSHSSVAIMGNIAYPLDNIPEARKHFGTLDHLLSCGLVMNFNIGDLDFAASREQLSYIPLTIKSIRAKLEELNANLALHLAAQVDAIDGEWNKSMFLQKTCNSRLYSSAVLKYVIDTKFELFDQSRHSGYAEIILKTEDLTKRGIDIKVFRHRNGQNTTMSKDNSTYINGNYVPTKTFPIADDIVIVLNDLKTGCQARAGYHYKNHNQGKTVAVYCVSHSSPDLAVRQLEYDKLIKELHNPPVVLMASALAARPKSKPLSTAGIAYIRLKHEKRAGDSDSYMWSSSLDEIDEDQTYYYIGLNGHQPLDANGADFNMFRIKALMDGCGVDAIKKVQIYGVRKNRIKEIQQLDNWVSIEDFLKVETAKITDSQILSMVAAQMLDTYRDRVYTNKNVAKLVGSDSTYAKYVTEIGSIERNEGDVSRLVQLCQLYGKAIQVDTVRSRIQSAKDGLYKKYPLLKFINNDSVPESHIAQYIKLIDKQENKNE
jgi:hypothetical protein